MLPANGVRVYLALGATDMRKSIDGLSILVTQQLQLDPDHLRPKSEKKSRTGQEQQLSLCDEAGQTVEEQKPQTFEEACTPSHARGKRGRRSIPADLPRVEIVHDLPEAEKTCPCGAVLVRIGEEVSEKLDIVPAKIQANGLFQAACSRARCHRNLTTFISMIYLIGAPIVELLNGGFPQ